jgi:hypothetical protein
MKVHITDGNDKLGAIPNISLPPVLSCLKGVPCAKSGCYAKKFFGRPSVKKAWMENYKLATRNRVSYFNQIRQYLTRKSPRFFRWHVSGDILDQQYLDIVVGIAKSFPKIKFLVFTKRYDLTFPDLPENLSIVFSMWPGWNPLESESTKWIKSNLLLPRAFMQDGTETRVPASALECPGNCISCGMCWHLKNLGRDVVFHKH